MPHAKVFHMPVKTSLKLVPPIGSDRADPKRKPFDHIIHELDGTILVMFWEDPQSSNTGSIINGCVLVTLYGLSLTIFQPQKLHIYLNMMPGTVFAYLFVCRARFGAVLGSLPTPCAFNVLLTVASEILIP